MELSHAFPNLVFTAALRWAGSLVLEVSKELRKQVSCFCFEFLLLFSFEISFFVFVFFFFFCFFHFRAALITCGSSQAMGQIRAAAAGLYYSHSNAESELHL